jgi:hypothetical protein
MGRANSWFYANKSVVNTWNNCTKAFLAKFFPTGKTNTLRGRISSFQKRPMRPFLNQERLQLYILACPYHRMDTWLILQNFYNGLTLTARDHIDTTADGAFFSLTAERATSLIDKMVTNQGWSDERLQSRQRVMHTVKETDKLAAKIDLLLKKFEDYPRTRLKCKYFKLWMLV